MLIRIFRGLAIGGALGIALAIAIELATSAAGGPIGPIPGRALRGEVAAESSPELADIESELEVAIEVRGARPRSVTTWMVVHGGELYIPADFMLPFKQWPDTVLEDERIVIRIRGLLYPARAVRVTVPQLVMELRRVVAQKYDVDPQGLAARSEVWFFWIDFHRNSQAQLTPPGGR
jgi:hypothetical protein